VISPKFHKGYLKKVSNQHSATIKISITLKYMDIAAENTKIYKFSLKRQNSISMISALYTLITIADIAII
jgi:hypothetical protein